MTRQREAPLPVALDGSPYPAFPEAPLQRVRWAFDAPIKSSSAKTVLVILALNSDKSGKAWPRLEVISRMASLKRRTIGSALKLLDESGWITREIRSDNFTLYRPKAPHEWHCHECWTVMVRDIPICSACGAWGVAQNLREVAQNMREVAQDLRDSRTIEEPGKILSVRKGV